MNIFRISMAIQEQNNTVAASIAGEGSFFKVIFSTQHVNYELISNQQVRAILDDFNALSDKNGPNVWIMALLWALFGACFAASAFSIAMGKMNPVYVAAGMMGSVAFMVSSVVYYSYQLKGLERVLSDYCFQLNGENQFWNFTYSKEIFTTIDSNHHHHHHHGSSRNYSVYVITIQQKPIVGSGQPHHHIMNNIQPHHNMNSQV